MLVTRELSYYIMLYFTSPDGKVGRKDKHIGLSWIFRADSCKFIIVSLAKDERIQKEIYDRTLVANKERT